MKSLRYIAKVTYVSIHAPTRGATQTHYYNSPYDKVSIHAPTRGATSTRSSNCFFNKVSIHAPTRGATLSQKHDYNQGVISIFLRIYSNNVNQRLF